MHYWNFPKSTTQDCSQDVVAEKQKRKNETRTKSLLLNYSLRWQTFQSDLIMVFLIYTRKYIPLALLHTPSTALGNCPLPSKVTADQAHGQGAGDRLFTTWVHRRRREGGWVLPVVLPSIWRLKAATFLSPECSYLPPPLYREVGRQGLKRRVKQDMGSMLLVGQNQGAATGVSVCTFWFLLWRVQHMLPWVGRTGWGAVVFFLAVLDAKSVRFSDPLLAVSCTSSRISAFLLALQRSCEGKGKAASPPSFRGAAGAEGSTYLITVQPQS